MCGSQIFGNVNGSAIEEYRKNDNLDLKREFYKSNIILNRCGFCITFSIAMLYKGKREARKT